MQHNELCKQKANGQIASEDHAENECVPQFQVE